MTIPMPTSPSPNSNLRHQLFVLAWVALAVVAKFWLAQAPSADRVNQIAHDNHHRAGVTDMAAVPVVD
jgi:hypothetical protein